MRFALVRIDRPGMAAARARLQPAHNDYQKPFLDMIIFGGGFVDDGTDTSAPVDIEDVTGNLLVFEAPDRETVELFQANDPYTLAGLFETAIIKPLWQRVPALE
jgi:uncharacterized protein YciI